MYARVTTVQGQADRLDAGIRTFQEQTVPLVQGQAGFESAYLLVDRQQGKALAISLWQSEQAMQQSEQAIAPQRTQAAQQMGASTPTVDRYEVIIAEGSGGGQAARVTSYQAPPERMDEAIALFRERTVPAVQGQQGITALYLLVDRQGGKALSLSLWASAQAMQQSEQMVQQLREQGGGQQLGVATTAVERYEVAVQG